MNCPRCHAEIPADGPAGMCPKCLLSVGLGEPEIVLTANGEPAPPPPTPAELQAFFPQFEIVRLVGRGGMGAVYEARQKGLGRTVALKILAAPARADATFDERFVRESQALARLSHENVVAVYDAGRAGLHYYLAMEYVDGPNLRQAQRAGRIEPKQALALVVQICTALDYAHEKGVVHRDIKPENVLLTREGRVKIADFGLAKVLDRAARGLSLTRASQTMGTPHYMAPEQVEHPKDVDHRADIYSLGVVFYELLTGELPLGRFPLPSQKVAIDVRLDDIVIRTLEKEPERRYQAAGEVRTAVQGVASTPMQSAPAAAIGASAPALDVEQRRPLRLVVRLLIGTLVALGAFLVLVLFLIWGGEKFTPASKSEAVQAQLDEAAKADQLAQTRAQEAKKAHDVIDLDAQLRHLLASQETARQLRDALSPPTTTESESSPGSLPPGLGYAGRTDRDPRDDWFQNERARNAAFEELHRRYVDLEAAHASFPARGPGESARVAIAPFTNERDALRDGLAELIARLPPNDANSVASRDVVNELFPYGDAYVEIVITGEAPAWIVQEYRANRVVVRAESDSLSERHRRVLALDRARRSR